MGRLACSDSGYTNFHNTTCWKDEAEFITYHSKEAHHLYKDLVLSCRGISKINIYWELEVWFSVNVYTEY